MVGGLFTATQFYADVEGRPEDPNVARALDELTYFTSSLQILGSIRPIRSAAPTTARAGSERQ